MMDTPGAKGLHLIPLSHVTQMRPSFTHVDEATSNATATSEDEVKILERAEAARLERKPLTFQKKESERAAMARKSSYSYKKASKESEIWLPLEVHGQGSPEVDEAMFKVPCPSPGDNILMDRKDDMMDKPFNTTYVNTLNYLPMEKKERYKEEGDEEITSVCSKLVRLMYLGWPIPFSVLREQFPKSVGDRTLIEALGSCAFLVRGNFILQSRLIPLKPEVAQARTFILFLLQAMGVVHRSRLNHVYKNDKEVTQEAILMLLEQVAKLTNEGWKLKVDDDESVFGTSPLAVQELVKVWATQVRRFKPLLERYGEQPSSPDE
jgi:DNA-directed RNA polymerase-3 subunit RPC5